MSRVATNPEEKERIKFLLSKEGKEDYLKLVKETVTYADLFEMFPSTLPALNYIAQFIPPIKPRLYSIASNPDKCGEEVHLCVIVDDWTTPSKKYRRGHCSGYLTSV